MRRTSTVIARFNPGVSTQSIHAFFDEHGIDGVAVSSTLNRYAIEVPTGKEKQFIQTFRDSGLFLDVQDNFLGGERPSTPFKKDDKEKKFKSVFKTEKTDKPKPEKPEVPHRDKKKPSGPRKDLRGGI